MTDIPISMQHAVRVALVFVGLIAGFGILSGITGWPDKQSWGMVFILSLVVASIPLWGPLLAFLRDSGAVVDIRGVKFDFTASAVHGTSVDTINLDPFPGAAVSDSSAASIAEAAKVARSAPIVVVDLQIGKSWYPTRLFVLAAVAEELQGARAIVIVAQRGGVPACFVGWVLAKDMVTAFCQSDNRYQLALNHARTVLAHLRLSGGYDTYKFPTEYEQDAQNLRRAYRQTGDLAFVPALIFRLQSLPAVPEPGTTPSVNAPLETPNQPNWLSLDAADGLLEPWMIRQHIREGLPESEKREILGRTDRDFLAVTADNGTYRGLIDICVAARRAALRIPGSART
jgi:hypothetical protein